MEALKKFQALRSSFPNPNSIIEDGMKNGKKVCGWLCVQVPEEIIEAGGMMPYRILGDYTKDSSLGDAYLYSNNCPYTRTCMATALRGGYKHIDALIAGNLCDHVRRLADEYKHYINDGKDLKYFFSWMPFKKHEAAVTAYRDQLQRMKETVEAASGRKITDDDLRQQIKKYNEYRSLLIQVAEYRKLPKPPITGSEFMEIVLAAQQSPKDEIIVLLKELLRELPNAPGKGNGPRIMLIGSELDDPGIVRTIEEAGSIVVADDLCTGNAYFWHKIDETIEDPLEALSKRYLTGISCPRMTPPDTKHDLDKYMIKNFNADAVIYIILKFCEPHASHYKMVKGICDELGKPVLFLERDYMAGGATGQVKTRVEAFMEQLLEI